MVAKSIANIYTNIHKPTDYKAELKHRHHAAGQDHS